MTVGPTLTYGDDAEIRMLLRVRFLELWTWSQCSMRWWWDFREKARNALPDEWHAFVLFPDLAKRLASRKMAEGWDWSDEAIRDLVRWRWARRPRWDWHVAGRLEEYASREWSPVADRLVRAVTRWWREMGDRLELEAVDVKAEVTFSDRGADWILHSRLPLIRRHAGSLEVVIPLWFPEGPSAGRWRLDLFQPFYLFAAQEGGPEGVTGAFVQVTDGDGEPRELGAGVTPERMAGFRRQLGAYRRNLAVRGVVVPNRDSELCSPRSCRWQGRCMKMWGGEVPE